MVEEGMAMGGIHRLRHLAASIRRAFGSRSLILAYHQVRERTLDPHRLCVTPQHFKEHLDVLQRKAQPLSLRQMIRVLEEGRIPDRAVAITFDDGYRDCLHAVKPLLESHNIPATVFVAAGYIGSEREFWWDALDQLLLKPGQLRETIVMSINGERHQWELGGGACYSQEDFERNRHWFMAMQEDPTLRHVLYRSLYRLLRPLSEIERRKALEKLQEFSITGGKAEQDHTALSPDEILRLIQGDLVEVGAHTISHPSLALLSEEDQRNEIWGSKTLLEEIVDRPVTSFAYPYGSLQDYTSDTIRLLGEAGFACACSTVPGAIRRGADRMQLSRCVVQDWNGSEFASRIDGYFRT